MATSTSQKVGMQLDPQFKLTFLGVLGLAILLLVVFVALAVWAPDPMKESQKGLMNVASHTFSLCVGFLVGGFGSKRASLR